MTSLVMPFIIAVIFGFMVASFFKFLCYGLFMLGMFIIKLHKRNQARIICALLGWANGILLFVFWLFNIGWDPRTEPMIATTAIVLGSILSSIVYLINTTKAITEK